MPDKQGIMPYTEPQDHCQLAACLYQELRLGRGVAHGLGLPFRVCLLLPGDPEKTLRHRAVLAADGIHSEVIRPEDPDKGPGFLGQPHAEGNA